MSFIRWLTDCWSESTEEGGKRRGEAGKGRAPVERPPPNGLTMEGKPWVSSGAGLRSEETSEGTQSSGSVSLGTFLSLQESTSAVGARPDFRINPAAGAEARFNKPSCV